MNITYISLGVAIGLIVLGGIRIVRPMSRGLIERLGKYNRFAEPGFHWIIPAVDRMVQINITENMADAEPQEIITKDKLNAVVDAQVYFKVKDTEKDVKASMYNVNRYEWQIVNLARTTLRNIIGTMSLSDANSERGKINADLMKTLIKETSNWGIEVVRTELKEINPPKNVQETMNSVVIAENQKQAAIDFASSVETKADGERRAIIKEAEGFKQASILKAEGQAKAFDLINKAFIGNAQTLKRLEVTENALKENTKFFIPENTTLVIGESGGIIPLKGKN